MTYILRTEVVVLGGRSSEKLLLRPCMHTLPIAALCTVKEKPLKAEAESMLLMPATQRCMSSWTLTDENQFTKTKHVKDSLRTLTLGIYRYGYMVHTYTQQL
jgi:hypothetical protein